MAAVARTEHLGYKAVVGLCYRAAAAAYPPRPPLDPVRCLGLDETAARQGHGDFKLVIVDYDAGRVREQLPDRRKETLRTYLWSWSADLRAAVEEVTHEVVAEV